MQTFLPTKNIRTTAKQLDYRRLGKQRVECKQILNALSPDYDRKGMGQSSSNQNVAWL